MYSVIYGFGTCGSVVLASFLPVIMLIFVQLFSMQFFALYKVPLHQPPMNMIFPLNFCCCVFYDDNV